MGKSGKEWLLSALEWVQERWEEILNAFYPPKCALCQGELAEGERGICRKCYESRDVILEHFCDICGKKLEKDQNRCYDCGQNRHEFVKGYSAFIYEEIKDSILRMKYHRESWRVIAFADWMGWLYEEAVQEWKIEAIASVPQSRWDVGVKGYNPPELLARELAGRWEIPFFKNGLRAHRKHVVQKKLGNKERKDNLKNTFYCKETVPYQRILLIDDVYTTGATLDACSMVLRQNGAREVYFLTIASGGYRR